MTAKSNPPRLGLLLLLGALTWAVPFIVSIPLMDPSGTPRVDPFLFKQIMLLTGAGVGTLCLVRALRDTTTPIRTSRRIGLCWFAINVLLDLLILVPISGMSVSRWWVTIGMGYLAIPIVAEGMGRARASIRRPSSSPGVHA